MSRNKAHMKKIRTEKSHREKQNKSCFNCVFFLMYFQNVLGLQETELYHYYLYYYYYPLQIMHIVVDWDIMEVGMHVFMKYIQRSPSTVV